MRLIERKLRQTGKRLGKGKYPRASFKYASYDTDPQPDVLVLGNWKNPTTKNNLIAGVNLNYLSSGQFTKLRKAAKRIFSRDSLRARYRYLKSILPDIAMYYRTYDAKYIKGIMHSELDSYTKTKPDAKDEKVTTAADFGKAMHAPEPEQEIDKQTDELDREAWRMKRRLYEPDKQRRRTSPERLGIAGSKAAKKAKAARYVRDRKKLKELERQVELARELRRQAELSREQEPEEPEDTSELNDTGEPIARRRRRTGDYGPEYHLDDLGYESYIRSHKPGSKLLNESKRGNLFAVFDILTEQFIVDAVISHAEMLFDAGWDYDHTVLFEIDGNELVVKSDCSDANISRAIECFRTNAVKNVLCESRLSTLIEKKQFSITAKPGVVYDKDEVNRALVALNTKPWGDETKFNASRWSYHLIKASDNWNGKTYKFEILPKVGRATRDNEKEQYIYKDPKGKSEIEGRNGYVYRGMSWDEWLKTARSKELSSTGSHNIGQEGLTFYGSADTAEYYANGFAPYSFKPSINKPGVVIEIPRSAVMDSTENKKIPRGEFAHDGSLPISMISRKWKLLPVVIKPGYLDVNVDSRGKVSEGTRFAPSVRHVVLEF
jgi:hypothetical protein